ncbi:MAG: hypothetical protein FWF29_01850, partial [Treponema sp.]|nr:hypothetical protein [Treponema sp.]
RKKIDPQLRAMCYTEKELDAIFLAVLGNTVSWLLSQEIDPAPETLQLLEKLQSENNNSGSVH